MSERMKEMEMKEKQCTPRGRSEKLIAGIAIQEVDKKGKKGKE